MRSDGTLRFLVRLLCFVPFAAGLFLLDWAAGEPPVRRLFTGNLDAAAEALVSGRTIVTHADMFDLKPIWIEHLHVHPDVLVLGSSRLAQIPAEWFHPRLMLNLSFLGGDFDDALAIFQECLDTGKTPKLVLLGLNPTLTLEGKTHLAPALAPHYRRALLRYGTFSPLFFSGPLLLDSLRWSPQTLWRQQPWKATAIMDPGSYRLRPDGSADWQETEYPQSADQVERDVRLQMRHLDADHRHWRTTSRPSWADRKVLLAFLDDLRARGIRPVVVLLPVHPAAYAFYTAQGGYNDSWIRSDMTRRGVTVVGSFSPNATGATRADFYDDVHVRLALIHRLLQESGIVQ